MASQIDVSILIPVRATEPIHVDWLREAVASVRLQSYPLREVLICDDHSTQDIRGFEDCKVYRLKEHGGVCQARNFLGKACETPYLVFLDADDKLYEGALAKMVARADPKKAIYGNLMLFGDGHAERYHNLHEFDEVEFLRHPIMPVTSLHTRDAFLQAKGFDPDLEGGLEEWDYNVKLMLAGICPEQLHEPVLWYRRHRGQRSAGRAWLREQTEKVRERYKRLEGTVMGCCGGRNRPRANNPRGNPAGALSASDFAGAEMVLIEYTGNRQGSITVKGRETNTSYRFGATQREKYVWPQDAPGILQLPGYRLVGQKPRVKVEPPDAVLLEQQVRELTTKGRPSPPDDLTVIKGLGTARAGKLAAVGITRYQNLAAADVANVAGLAGVSEKEAASWIEQARELA